VTNERVTAQILAQFPQLEKDPSPVKDYPTLRLPDAASLLPVISHLKDSLGFSYLDMVTAVDWKGPVDPAGYVREERAHPFQAKPAAAAAAKPLPGAPYRDAFTLVYALSRFANPLKIFLKLDVPREQPRAASLARIFRTADWQEREVFDLFGIFFDGHPDLRRILTLESLQGHPLRKDYAHAEDRFDR
jgi:NADH:ubiquinone oxidoreductase subunit C